MVGHVWAWLQDVLVEPSVFASRDTLSEGASIPCHSWNPISNKRPRFLLYTIYVEREMKAFLLDDYYIVLIDIIIISKGVNIKIFWIFIREKPVPLYGVVL